jgi:hypothetical protein
MMDIKTIAPMMEENVLANIRNDSEKVAVRP